MKRNCDHCGTEYNADERNIKRGWGLCCSKSCSASKREKSKPGYNPDRVAFNNMRRDEWNSTILDKSAGDKCFVDDDRKYKGRTSEGYRIYGTTAYDEWGDAVYEVDPYENTHPHESSNF